MKIFEVKFKVRDSVTKERKPNLIVHVTTIDNPTTKFVLDSALETAKEQQTLHNIEVCGLAVGPREV